MTSGEQRKRWKGRSKLLESNLPSDPKDLKGIRELCVCVLSFYNLVQLFVTPWMVACQAALSMRFSRQEYWSGLSFPPPGDIPDPGFEPASLISPALAGRFFTISTTWEAQRNPRTCTNNHHTDTHTNTHHV